MLIFVSVHCFWCTERCPEWDATVRIRVQLLHQVTSFYCCVRLLESSKEELQNKGLKNARLLASTHRPSSVVEVGSDTHATIEVNLLRMEQQHVTFYLHGFAIEMKQT